MAVTSWLLTKLFAIRASTVFGSNRKQTEERKKRIWALNCANLFLFSSPFLKPGET